ncbi:LuxR family transcriptional regulator [Kitasatospora sp. A2-31]|uniref:response regulator transcription factor n=1 Tax=Kitasatospora sp. A2-31 TaxID=2916414 RepID=UPI001EE9F5F1|nr:response regulator transcription factor [Kitasatospora sp. A2-31]MCG6495621.1 response regulator transcription factor [Kitasatospora sp. A2-31]
MPMTTVPDQRSHRPTEPHAAASAPRGGTARRAGGVGVIRSIGVAVLAGDPITGEGTTLGLRRHPGLRLLEADDHPTADVALVVTTRVTEETMTGLEDFAARSVNPGLGIVLVTEGVREHQVLRAVGLGLRGVLWRQECDFDQVLEVVRSVAVGGTELPPTVQGWLVGGLRAVQRDVLGPRGLTTAGLETRELDVLRLLADGLDTADIARELSYSERTIKNIVSGMMTRLGFRNRTHAVVHAIRTGVL